MSIYQSKAHEKVRRLTSTGGGNRDVGDRGGHGLRHRLQGAAELSAGRLPNAHPVHARSTLARRAPTVAAALAEASQGQVLQSLKARAVAVDTASWAAEEAEATAPAVQSAPRTLCPPRVAGTETSTARASSTPAGALILLFGSSLLTRLGLGLTF